MKKKFNENDDQHSIYVGRNLHALWRQKLAKSVLHQLGFVHVRRSVFVRITGEFQQPTSCQQSHRLNASSDLGAFP